MAYSTIQKKKCKGNCGKYPTLGYNGFCYSCAPDEIKEKVKSQKSETAKKRDQRIASKLKTLPENIEMVNHKLDLEEFFRVASLELSLNPICDECSDFIPAKIYRLKNNVWVEVDNYRNCTAHILFKSMFPSVSCNHHNRLFLCNKNGCHERTHRLDTFSKMKIFPTAVLKFRLFENEIKESNKFLHAFREYANNLNTIT